MLLLLILLVVVSRKIIIIKGMRLRICSMHLQVIMGLLLLIKIILNRISLQRIYNNNNRFLQVVLMLLLWDLPRTTPPKRSVSNPPQEQQEEAAVPSEISEHMESYDAGEDKQEKVDLDDLDDLIFGGGSKKDDCDQQASDELDLLISGSSLDASKEKKDPVYNNPNQYDEVKETSLTKLENTAAVLAEPEQQVPANDIKGAGYKQDQTESQEAFSYEPQQQSEQTIDYNLYEPQHDQAVDYPSYELQHDQALNSSYEPQQQTEQTVNYTGYLPNQQQQTEQAVDHSGYQPQQQQQADQAFDYSNYPQQQQQQTDQAVDYSGYLPNQQAVGHSSYEPQAAAQDASYSSMYQPQQQADEQPQQTERAVHSSYEPPQNVKPPQVPEATSNQALPPPPKRSMVGTPPVQRNMVGTPPPRSVVSPPPRRNMISPSPAMQSFAQKRSNSITEPDRTQNGSPFTGHYSQHIARSATVPPPMTERSASPRPILTACPDPACEGENKAKAKFCCECGRPLPGISRSTTPSASLSPGVFSMHDTFSPVIPPVPSALDQKKETMMSSLKQFMEYSVVVQSENEDKQKLALKYIESRVPEFEESKALLWNIVKLMIQYQDHTLGDGGELDKSISKLLCTQSNEETHLLLDKLEEFLVQGDRDGACEFAAENDMWAHALIISQSQGSEAFKRVMAQFIDRELFSTGDKELKVQVPGDKKSLRMLYSVFSGAGADAVLELARNSVDEHATACTKESLQDWKKALGLVLCNRSSNDLEAIKGLGDQLKKTDSLQDAYICYMLSPDTFKSLESQIIAAEGVNMYMNLDALYLTELYEFGLSKKMILNQYKLILAWWLSEFGFAHESQVYRDMIAKNVSSDELQQLKKIGEICNTSTDTDVTSLLNKESFDTLIGSIEGTSSFGYMQHDSNGITHDFTGQEAHDTLQGENYNYGHGYGGGYTGSADNNQATVSKTTTPFGMQTPFQNNVRPVASPFAVGGGVHSPFQHGYTPTETTDTTAELYQPETPAVTDYTPDAYVPQPDAQTTVLDDNDEDDLGFGNSKAVNTTSNDDTTAEKPNEANKEEQKETKAAGGGWGIFALFGRKEKGAADAPKPIKANLGEQSSFHYDPKEKRWVNKQVDAKRAAEAAAAPPPPRAGPPQPAVESQVPPPAAAAAAGVNRAGMPPTRVSSTPNAPTSGGPPSGGPPSVAIPTFNTPPVGRRAGGSARKAMRARYVDVLNTEPKQ
ncbi:Sec23-binding domain of Sec16-domain-containing protein [Helicostylum pulchrum]|nr:Sec23-binding domain of Sec16-domain-containing protein [Helicostylum pulchrum]